MEIIGYSERGIINSLFYEIKYSQKSINLFNQFLSLMSFPYRTVDFQISEVKILIEQSFSDFGDADVLLLLDNQDKKQVIFIEAKVKTFQKSSWNIKDEFDKFKALFIENKQEASKISKSSSSKSNLFVQLYFKVKMVQALQTGGMNQLKEGVVFPECLSKQDKRTQKRCLPRKIGNNEVVLTATKLLLPYSKDALFVALVPSNTSELNKFYQGTLKNYRLSKNKDWGVENWGYISWADVKKFCKKNRLENTLRVFEFNKGQIYDDGI